MKTVFFHKGKGSKTRSSDFSGLRMRDGPPSRLLDPVRGLSEYSSISIGGPAHGHQPTTQSSRAARRVPDSAPGRGFRRGLGGVQA